MTRSRTASAVAALVLAPVLLVVGAVAFNTGADERPTAAEPVPVSVGAGAGAATVQRTIEALQARLRRLPGDADSWTSLGFAYVAQARSTADPSFYPKAEESFVRALRERPDDASALAGQASLANARHEFAAGRDLALRAVELDAYDATAKGVLADAQLELGEYDAALDTLQQMVDLAPRIPSFTRISYAYELRGDLDGARHALDRCLAMASAPADASFALFHLAELAWSEGDYKAAAEHVADGLRRDPNNVTLIAERAKIAAADGDIAAALADYAVVVERLPQPSYLVEYGELLESLGRSDEAQAQYDVADATSTLFAAAGVVADIELALYAADHGRPEDALRTAEAQYETRRSVQVEDALAWALHMNGRDQEALEHALAAAALGSRNALWDYHRGMIQLALGLEDDALASLKLALAANPAFSSLHAPMARAALDHLTDLPESVPS